MKQLIIGKKAILDAIKNKTLSEVITSNKDMKFFNQVKDSKIKTTIKNDESFYNKLTNSANHQLAIGYVLLATKIVTIDDLIKYVKEKPESNVLILDEINDPYNFGSIIRTAENFGFDAIIYKKNNQCQINETVIRVSIGAITNINMIKVANINDCIDKLKNNGFWIYASCLDKQSQPLSKIKFDKKSAIIIGNEQSGISKLTLEKSDFKVLIETKGKTQSLNAAVATAILCYFVSKN